MHAQHTHAHRHMCVYLVLLNNPLAINSLSTYSNPVTGVRNYVARNNMREMKVHSLPRAHFLLLKYTHSQMYTHRHTHTNTRTHAHTQTHTRIHACARTHTCTHSLTHTLTSPFTHTLPEKNYSRRHQELHNFVGALNCQIVATNEPYFEMIFLQKGHDDIGSIPMIASPLCFGC